LKSSSKYEKESSVAESNGGDSRLASPFASSLGMNSLRNTSNQLQRLFDLSLIPSFQGTASTMQENGCGSNTLRGIGPTLDKKCQGQVFKKTPTLTPGANIISSQFSLRRSLNPIKEVSLTIPDVEYEKARDLLKFQIRRQLYSNQRVLACLRSDTLTNNTTWKSYQMAALEHERKMLMAQLQYYGA
jgi:hypothetical protein